MIPTPQQASYKHAFYQYVLNSKVLIMHKNKPCCGLMVCSLLTLSAHVQRGLQYLVCVSVCVCACACVTQHLIFHMFIHATNDTNLLSGR